MRVRTCDLDVQGCTFACAHAKRASTRDQTLQNTLGTFSLHSVCYVPGEFARVLRGGFLRLTEGSFAGFSGKTRAALLRGLAPSDRR